MDDRFNFTFNDDEESYANTYGEEAAEAQVFMSNSFNGTQQTEGYYSSPVRMQRNRKPLIISLIILGAAAVVCTALWVVLMNMGSSYERAERNSFGSLSSGFDALINPQNTSQELILTLTPADMDKITLITEAVTSKNGDFYVKLGGGMGDISLSVLMWQVGERLLLQIPELTDYYIGVDNNYSTIDYKELQNSLGRVANKYFELTKEAEKIGGVEVRAGGLSVVCDKYIIVINEYMLNELNKETLRALMDNNSFMQMMDDTLNAQYDQFEGMGTPIIVRMTAKQVLQKALDELEANVIYAGKTLATMNVYVSGNKVVKREIVFADESSLTFTGVEDKNNYATLIEIDAISSWGDRSIFSILDKGTVSGGVKNGSIDIDISDGGLMSVTAVINYTNLKEHSDGLFSGEFELSVPNMFLVEMTSVVNGKTQTITGSASIPGTKLLDFEVVFNADTGKTVTAPDTSGGKVLDPTKPEDLEKLGEVFMEAIMSLLPDSIGGLFGMNDYNDYYDYNYYSDLTTGDIYS